MHETEQKKSNFWIELLKLAAIALAIVIPFRLYIAQPFIVEGASMDPTFKNGQYLIVDELSYKFKSWRNREYKERQSQYQWRRTQ